MNKYISIKTQLEIFQFYYPLSCSIYTHIIVIQLSFLATASNYLSEREGVTRERCTYSAACTYYYVTNCY